MRFDRQTRADNSREGRPAAFLRGVERPSRRFRNNRKGSVAIEFSIVAIPFFIFLFAIIEISLMFFVGQVLDNAVNNASRQIRTGQAAAAGMNAATFKDTVCTGMLGLGNCASNLHFQVNTVGSFSSADLTSALDADGNLKPSSYADGGPGKIMIVRVFYTWPVFFNILSTSAQTADGKRILSSIVAFQSEPYSSELP